MKHGKNPTRAQRKKILELGLQPANWLVVKDTSREMWIEHRHTGNVRKKVYSND